jgi:hypothetical protein
LPVKKLKLSAKYEIYHTHLARHRNDVSDIISVEAWATCIPENLARSAY